jgi:hypothetical protein
LRPELIRRWEASLALYGPRLGVCVSPWPAKIAACRAGEPVELSGWELRAACGAVGIPAPHGRRFLVDCDGRIEVTA